MRGSGSGCTEKLQLIERPTSPSNIKQEHEKEVETQIQKLVGERNFAAAAALREEFNRSAAQEKDEEFEADVARLLARRDFAGAAALQFDELTAEFEAFLINAGFVAAAERLEEARGRTCVCG